MDAGGGAHTPSISNADHIHESEKLARRFFSIGATRLRRAHGSVHDDVTVVSKVRPGEVFEGKDAVVRFVQDTLADSLYEAPTTIYLPIDDSRVVVEGRLRWIDDDRVIRDDPVTWAVEFRDELLSASFPRGRSSRRRRFWAPPRSNGAGCGRRPCSEGARRRMTRLEPPNGGSMCESTA